MKTMFETPKEYAEIALKLAEETPAVGTYRPVKFQRILYTNRGQVANLSPFPPCEDGLERRNPLIVALGDSVTAGHFEFAGDPKEIFRKLGRKELKEEDAIEIVDVREGYPDRFRNHLIDCYEQTSLSVINSGIAGDTVLGMQKRLERDVLRYQPDLILFNASLNWGYECGDLEVYRRTVEEILSAMQSETDAEIVVMTPNMEIPLPFFMQSKCTLEERVQVLRELAEEKKVCLADTYRVWEAYKDAGYPLEALLANGTNHPSKVGHEMYARVLMQLFEK